MNSVDCVVVGAGAVGLAIGRAFAQCGFETLIIDAGRQIGTGESSRNSEVIHAGIYYPEGSLKARLCVTGRHALYDYCTTHGIPHRRCGKLIVATNAAQVERLQALQLFARAAGVQDLVMLSAAATRRLEPELCCVAALESPSTGILDSHAYMLALQGDAEAAGALVALDTEVTGFKLGTRSIELRLDKHASPSLRARVVVNSAGLGAQALAATLPELPSNHIPPLHLAKGNYFSLTTRAPFSRLIYPLPQSGGLGVHLTLDLNGRARFGPDVEWLNSPDYQIDPARSTQFYGSIRDYWPGLPDGSLTPGYAGIRAKLSGPGERVADFVISGPKEHGIPGLINLFGIESPGLTSSLAIGAHVVSLAMKQALPA